MTPEEQENLTEQAIELFNDISEATEKRANRALTKDELEYIREKVMLHFFGFYEREEVDADRGSENNV